MPDRMITLEEWMGKLPDIHIAHVQYRALLQLTPGKFYDEDAGEYKPTQPGVQYEPLFNNSKATSPSNDKLLEAEQIRADQPSDTNQD